MYELHSIDKQQTLTGIKQYKELVNDCINHFFHISFYYYVRTFLVLSLRWTPLFGPEEKHEGIAPIEIDNEEDFLGS